MHTPPDLYDQARLEAARLRREAVADFWRGADHLMERAGMTAAARVERSARNLRTRLARRAAQRALSG